MNGAISGIKQTRAADVLRALVSDGCVATEDVDAWSKLRNICAHGNLIAEEKAQEAFDRIGAVTTLLHKLLMAHIGYRGQYKNYGKRGWPVEDWSFNASSNGQPYEVRVQIDAG